MTMTSCWTTSQLVASTIAGPLQGIPAIGEALQSTIAVATGGWNNSGNLLSGFGKHRNLAGKLNFQVHELRIQKSRPCHLPGTPPE